MLSKEAGSGDAAKVFAHIAKDEKRSVATKLNFISALLFAGNPDKDLKDDIKALGDKYGREKRKQEVTKGALARDSAKQVFAKGVTFTDVADFVNEKLRPAAEAAAEEVLSARKKGGSAVKVAATEDSRLRSLVKYFILKLHVTRPLRNDFRSLRIVYSTKKGFTEPESEEAETEGGAAKTTSQIQDSERAAKNVIVFSRGKGTVAPVKILIRVHKTARSHPDAGVIDFADEGLDDDAVFVKTALALYHIAKASDSKFLFTPLSSGLYNNLISSTLKPVAPGIGSSILRKLYDSQKWGEIEKEREADAAKMGHSVSIANKYYTTVIQKPKDVEQPERPKRPKRSGKYIPVSARKREDKATGAS
jgi:hypothetical protein